jgi:hypothetical protein
MSNREPQILLKADERSIVLELSRDGKFAAKSSGWGENLVCLEGDKIEVAVKNGRRGAYALPASRPNGCDAIFRAPETVVHRW